jgi:UDPglucose 6-dehydrogenase
MNVCMVGTGYVGLVTGAGLAELGNRVVCADVEAKRIEALARGELPIYEPGLDELVERGVREKRLSFTSDVDAALRSAHVVFVTVGTPPRADGGADLSAVFAVAERAAELAERELVLVLKSTVPVGTNARVRKLVSGARHRVHVVSNPEFLKEGDAVTDFLRPDRVVIGCERDDQLARTAMTRLYRPLQLDRERILWMDPPSAELTKYVANSMLALRISFMNEVAALCEKVGADAHMVRFGVGSDGRIGPKFLYAGPGYGGSCFPKDVQALIHTAREHGLELDLACATHRVNERQKGILLRKLKAHFDGFLRGKRIAVWGLAFKPRTDDIRESPALTLIDSLLSEGAVVAAHDPHALPSARQRYEDRVRLVEDEYEAAHHADALVLVTEWTQYRSPDFERLRERMRTPAVLIDGRNVWSQHGLWEQGFIYEGIGVKGTTACGSW